MKLRPGTKVKLPNSDLPGDATVADWFYTKGGEFQYIIISDKLPGVRIFADASNVKRDR